jgi:hypothetical protein
VSSLAIRRIRARSNYKARKSIVKRTSNICYYCGKPLTIREKTIDHRTPLSRGGEDTYSNLVVACSKCNAEKDCMTEAEYADYLLDKNSHVECINKVQVVCNELSDVDRVDIDLIEIPYSYLSNPVRESKKNRMIDYYKQNGEFDKPITLISKQNKRLTDGYSRYIAAQELKVQYVPVVYKN